MKRESREGLLLTLFVAGFFFHAGNIVSEAAERADSNKILMVIAHEGFSDEEMTVPKEMFEAKGLDVVVASSSKSEAKGMLGRSVKPDALLSEVKAEDFSAVVFVGGIGAKTYWNDATALGLARDAHQQGRVVAAICIAPVILANAGLLEGKRVAVWPSEKGRIEKKGGRCTGADVEVDGRLITANGPKAAGEFGRAILTALER